MTNRMQAGDVEEELRDTFRVFDKDGNGFISRSELRQVLEKMGEKISEAEIDDMIDEVDSDGDGEICYEEFVKMLSNK